MSPTMVVAGALFVTPDRPEFSEWNRTEFSEPALDVYSNYKDIGLRLIGNAAVWLVGWTLFLYYYKLRHERGRLGDNASFFLQLISWCVYLFVGVWVIGIMIKAI